MVDQSPAHTNTAETQSQSAWRAQVARGNISAPGSIVARTTRSLPSTPVSAMMPHVPWEPRV